MRHFIIVKFHEDVDKDALLPPIKELFEACLSIDGVHDVKLHLSCSQRPNRYDMMIELIMEPEALPIYDNSESHRTWKAEYGKYIAAKAIFDCD